MLAMACSLPHGALGASNVLVGGNLYGLEFGRKALAKRNCKGASEYKPWPAAEAAIGMDLRQCRDVRAREPKAQPHVLAVLSFFTFVTSTEAMSAAKPAN